MLLAKTFVQQTHCQEHHCVILILKQNNSSRTYIINLIENNFTATDDKIKAILQAQDEDPVCQKIKSFVSQDGQISQVC